MTKTHILCSHSAGLPVIRMLAALNQIDTIIGLSDNGNRENVASYLNLREEAKALGVNFVEVNSYSLKKVADKECLLGMNIETLIVAGWQRLVPEWLIDHCNGRVIGGHGSPDGINKGRGRSPMNWSIMAGQNSFYISIFWITPRIDDGRVIDTKSFSISDSDDINSCYMKSGLLCAKMISDFLNSGGGSGEGVNQAHSEAKYLPQRTPEDSGVDWRVNSNKIDRLVRALTKPYPSAFTHLDGQKLDLYSGVPLKLSNDINETVGKVIAVNASGGFVVTCGVGLYLVENHSHNNDFLKNPHRVLFKTLSSSDIIQTMNGIEKRHSDKMPDAVISDIFYEYKKDLQSDIDLFQNK